MYKDIYDMKIMLGSSYAIHGGIELSMRSASGIQGARHMYIYVYISISHIYIMP